MKTLTVIAVAAFLAPAWAVAQNSGPALDLNFPNLAAKASKKAEVDVDGNSLALAGRETANALAGVKGVHVRHYEFAEGGTYPASDLDPLRRQVEADSAWSRIVNVKEDGESTQIYILKTDSGPGGLLVISAEAKEVNVVEVLGTVDLAHMQELVKSTISYDLKAAGASGK